MNCVSKYIIAHTYSYKRVLTLLANKKLLSALLQCQLYTCNGSLPIVQSYLVALPMIRFMVTWYYNHELLNFDMKLVYTGCELKTQ